MREECDFFQSLLGDIDVERFRMSYLGQRHFLDVGEPHRFEDLICWSDVESMLEDRYFAQSQVQLAKEKAKSGVISVYPRLRAPTVHHKEYVDVAAVSEKLRLGSTLICNNVGERVRAVSDGCGVIERHLGCRVWANAYIAPPSSTTGFGRHWDDHDVLIVQVAGAKRWHLYEAQSSYPMDNDFDETEPSDKILWSGVLEQGSVLFVPRGMWHDVDNVGQCSLHLTIGIQTDKAYDFLRWMIDESIGLEPLLRTDIPHSADEATKTHYIDLLRRVVAQRITTNTLSVFEDYQRSQHTPKPRFSLPWAMRPDEYALPDDIRVKAGRIDLSAIREIEDGLVVGRGKRGVRAPKEAAPLLRHLAGTKEGAISVGDLKQKVDGDRRTFDDALRQIVNVGLAQVADG